MAVRLSLAVLLVLCCASHASGQIAATHVQDAAPQAPQDGAGTTGAAWLFSAAVYIYQVPDDRNYPQVTLTSDRNRLHLEGRYNYEDLDSGSVWLGYNLQGGQQVAWEFTPMLGGIFGHTSGFAPAYKGSVSWRNLELSSEGEYVFAAAESSENFFYNWSELAFAPAEWWRIGLVTQRTHVYATERDIQRGLLVGFTYKAFDSAIYVLNPDDSKPVVVAAVTVSF